MKSLNTRSVFMAAALMTIVSYSGLALAHGYGSHHSDHHNKPVCKTTTVSTTQAGPAPYHAVYSAIKATNITLQNFTIRTEDGLVLNVPSAPMTVNLQDLSGFAKGFLLSLKTVDFPGGVDTIQAAEIQMDVVKDSSAAAVSDDGSSCALSFVPKHLNFYTGAAIPLGHDDYHVKIDFSPLNGLEINVVTTVKQTTCCVEKSHQCNVWNKKKSSNSHQMCESSGEVSSTAKKCRMSNRRYAIGSIVRAVDDNF